MPRLGELAVVIPVGPGDGSWRGLLPALAALPGDAEIVLSMAAGDRQAPAADARANVIRGAPGRARQLNAGVAASRRRWLWFLHADSRIDDAALAAIEAFGDDDALGYFDLRFFDGGWRLRINALGVWIRSRWLRLPFGDQGLLLPRARFEALGGYDETLDGGEDHALVWAARRAGLPLRPLGATLATSARKYRERGWWRTTRDHLRLTLAQARRFARSRP